MIRDRVVQESNLTFQSAYNIAHSTSYGNRFEKYSRPMQHRSRRCKVRPVHVTGVEETTSRTSVVFVL